MVQCGVQGDELAARRQRVEQGRHDLYGLVVVRREVQDGDRDEGDRLAEVGDIVGLQVGEDARRVAQVGVDVSGAPFPVR